MSKTFFLLFLFFGSTVLSNPSNTELASFRSDPSILINGCINAMTGDFVFEQKDLAVQGAHPIEFPRRYISSQKPEKIETLLIPHQDAIGTTNLSMLAISELRIPEPNGMTFSYKMLDNFSMTSPFGDDNPTATGYCTDSLGARYHPRNNQVFIDNVNHFIVKTSTGEERNYVNFSKTGTQTSNVTLLVRYKLAMIHLSNNMLVKYSYKNKGKGRLKKITISNPIFPKDKRNFSSLELKKEDSVVTVIGSDKRSTTYTFDENNEKYPLLKKVVGNLFPEETLRWKKKHMRILKRKFPNDRTLSCEYNKAGKVTKLIGPQGTLAEIEYSRGKTISRDREGNKTVYEFDPNILQTKSISYFDGESTLLKKENFKWNPFGCLETKEITSPDGKAELSIHHTYNFHLDPIKTKISGDQEYCFFYKYDNQYRLIEEREDNGNRTTYAYLGSTSLLEEVISWKEDQLLKRICYRYNDDNLLVEEITDGNSPYCFTKKIERKRSPPFYGMVKATTESCNGQMIEKTELDYDKWGNVTYKRRYDANGELAYCTHTRHNEKGQITDESDPLSNITTYQYDENGNLIWKKTPLGLEIHSIYDKANRLIEEKQIGSGQILITRYEDFDPLDHPKRIIDPLGGITLRKYDAVGNILEETNPNGHTTTYQYDVLGNITCQKDPLGNLTQTSYNLYGSPLKITYPDGSKKTYSYNPDGTCKSFTDEAGVTTLYHYDLYGNLSIEEIQGEAKKTKVYDTFHLLEETNLDGYTTIYAYDDLGRKSSETYEGKTIYYTYDPLCRIAEQRIGTVRTEWTYDNLNNPLTEKIYDGNTLTYQSDTNYDCDGNPLTITSYPHNKPAVTRYQYDSFGRQITKITPLGRKTTTTYTNEPGTKSIATKEPGNITTIEIYNKLDQCISVEQRDPDSNPFSRLDSTYDPNGNLQKETTTVYEEGEKKTTHTISWTYDARNRKTEETESNLKTTHYTYTPDGKLKTLIKPDGVILHHEYNPLGQLTTLKSSKGDIDYTYTYTKNGELLLAKNLIHQTQTERILDPHGNILEERMENDTKLQNTYDEMGRRTQLILPERTIHYRYLGHELAKVKIDNKEHNYIYDLSSNLIEEKHIDGTITKYSYDQDGRLLSRISPQLSETIEYDERGNILHIRQNGQDNQYTYNYQDQLIEEPGHKYRYDSLENRVEKDGQKTTFNPLNQETELGYDQNGNLLKKGSYTLEYDSLDRLINVKTWFTTTTYTYDSEHRRILENSRPILWDGQHEMGEPNFFRILGRTPFAEIGAAVAICDRGRLLQPLHTVTGDVFQIIDQPPIQHFTAFGEGTAAARWGYQSKVHDHSGLIYFGRRYYDPTSGRFITSDPEGYTDGRNLYAYVKNNPLIYHDPYGLFVYLDFDPNIWKEVGAAIGHGALSCFRDVALSTANALGGVHGTEDMSFLDITTAHQAPQDRFAKRTNDWMNASPYAGGDLYHLVHGISYHATDLALTGFIPVTKLAKAGQTGYKLTKTFAKTRTFAKTQRAVGKIFQSNQIGTSIKNRTWSNKKPNFQNHSIIEQIESFLGKDSKAFRNSYGDLVIESKDTLRQFRMDFNHPAPHKNPHSHIIKYETKKNKKIEIFNQRVYPTDVIPE